MSSLTLPRPAPAERFVLQPPPTDARSARRRPRTPLRARPWHRVALGTLLIACLLVRLWGIRQGLPYSYNVDEAQHFVPRAIAFFVAGPNPHYFLNPPAYSYVLTAAFELWFGGADAVARAYTLDPTAVFVVARVVASLLGVVAVWLTYLAGARMFTRGAGLLAGAVLGLAFLPVFYSHLALNDVPTLAPVALSLWAIAGVYRDGRARHYLIAGAAIGLAAATKYTGGVTLVCLLGAAVLDARRRSGAAGARGAWTAVQLTAAALVAALAAFTLANPYWILDWRSFTAGISDQASLAAGSEPVKLGTGPGSGIAFYLQTFTWGFGWVPSIAALWGAVMALVRRRWAAALVLLPAPVLFVVFMGEQQRYFGRWLMPVFPIAALLAGWAAVSVVGWLADRVPGRGGVRAAVVRARIWSVLLGALVTVALLAQGVAALVHDDQVLSRPDTRNLTRAWMVAHVPAGAKVVIEPVVSAAWPTDVGRSLAWTRTGQRWYQYPTWLSRVGVDGRPYPDGKRRYVPVDEYERVLYPGLIAKYEAGAYCWVVTGTLQEGRALAQPGDAPGAIAYYRELRRQGRLVYRISPFSPGARPVPFGFDRSIDYLPSAYRLPGPVMSVYQLTGGRCGGVR